jgi:hypothetical protein
MAINFIGGDPCLRLGMPSVAKDFGDPMAY